VFGSVAFGVIALLLIAISNGISVSACFGIASTMGEEDVKKVSGYLLIASMFTGITFGCIWPIIVGFI